MKRAAVFSPIAALAVVLLIVSIEVAQSGGGYDGSWNTIDGGWGVSGGGSYVLYATIGQPDAGVISGGNYVLESGFWNTANANYRVFLPVVLR